MTFPALIQWTPILFQGQPLFDPPGDEAPISTDIVGNTQFPAAFYAYDGTNAFFRLRLNGDPRFATGFRNFAWGVLFDTDGNPSTYEWLLTVNGLNGTLNLIENTVKIPNSWNDPAEGTDGRGTPNYSASIVNYDIARASLTNDGSNFGGNPDYFLDFLIPTNILFPLLGINEETVINLLFFTSANNNNYNKDSLQNQGFSFAGAFSDDLEIEDGDVRADLSLASRIVSGPNSLLTATQSTWQIQLNVMNVGRSLANSVLVTERVLLDKITNLSNITVTQGLTTALQSGGQINWNIGNLSPGSSATLTFTVSGDYTTANGGTRILSQSIANGFDQFTGSTLAPRTSQINLSVTPRGGLSGRVLDQSSGLAIVAATVELRNQQGQTIATTTSTSNGGYSFSDIAPGDYTLLASAQNYNTRSTSVTVLPGQVSGINLSLTPTPATVLGMVTDPTGEPLAEVVIRLINGYDVVLATATTAQDGTYQIENIQPGNYTLTVSRTGFTSATRPIMLNRGETQTANFQLSPIVSTLEGIVASQITNQPITHAVVSALDTSGKLIAQSEVNAAGEYLLTVAPGTYRIRIAANGFETIIVTVTLDVNEQRQANFTLAPNPGAITGTVTDANTGDPLPNIFVRIVMEEGFTINTVQTDAAGTYTVPNLVPGAYSLIFADSIYGTEFAGAIVFSDQITTLNVTLTQITGVLAGTVRNEAGEPIPDTVIRVFLNNVIVAVTETDFNGSYMVPGLQPNQNYTVTASADGFARQLIGASIEPFVTTPLDFTLAPLLGILEGQVTGPADDPISGASVIVRQDLSSGIIVARTITDIDGFYSINNLAPGNYYVVVSANTFQNSFNGAIIRPDSITILDFTLQPSPGEIVGTLLDATTNQPIQSTEVQIKVLSANGVVVLNTFAEPSGDFLIGNLAPGTYTIIATVPGYQTGEGSISVGANQSVFLSITLAPSPGSISGIVTDALTGEPISGAVVKVTNENQYLISTIVTDSFGRYIIEGLPPETYSLNVTAANYQTEIIGAIVRANQVTTINVQLEANPGTLAGTLLPNIPGAIVQLFDINNIFIGSIVTDPEGAFEFINLAPGQYILVGSAPNFARESIIAQVSVAELTTISITLTPNPGQIVGQITTPLDQPIPNALIKVLSPDDIVLGIQFSDNNGQYIIPNLAPGSYIVVASADNFSTAISGAQISPAGTATVDITLQPDHGGISGNVTDVLTGETIEGAAVQLRALDATGFNIISVSTTPFGNYFIDRLLPGNYTLIISAPNYATATVGVTVISNRIVGGDAALSPLFGVLEGTVTDSVGNPIGDTAISIRIYTPSIVLVTAVLAFPDGTFSVQNLSPGEYLVNVLAPGFSARSSAFLIEADTTTTIAVALLPLLANLQGIVTDTETRQPIEGCLVEVITPENIPLSTQITSENGEFIFDSLPAGSFITTANAALYSPNAVGVILDPNETTFTRIDLTQQNGEIFGLVSDFETGEEIVGATVQLFDEGHSLLKTVVTNDLGEYTMPEVRPGIYILEAIAIGYASRLAGAIVSPGVSERISFALVSEPATIQGQITNIFTEAPISGAFVEIRKFNSNGPVVSSLVTDEEGNYRTSILTAGNYVIIVTAIGFAKEVSSTGVTRGQTVTVNVQIFPDPAIIQGQITDENNVALPGAAIELYDVNNVLQTQTLADADGHYRMNDVQAGSYNVTASLPSLRTATQNFTIDFGETITINLTLLANPTEVIGRIVTEDTRNPVTGTVVTVLDPDGFPVGQAVTDGLGEYRVQSLQPGEYQFTASSFLLGTRTGRFSTLIVSSAEANLALAVCPGHLQGRVTDEDGMPLYKALIEVIDHRDNLARTVITNEDGNYFVYDLAPGHYNVRFSFPEKETLTKRARIICNKFTILNAMLLDGEKKEDNFDEDNSVDEALEPHFMLDDALDIDEDDD